MKTEIKVVIKLYSGIDRDNHIQDYDPATGIVIHLPRGTRLKRALKQIGITEFSSNAYYRDGTRIGLWSKLKDGDEISCLRPSGGG